MQTSITSSTTQPLPLWRKLLFSQPFRFESKLSPEDYAAAVQKFESLRGAFWQADYLEVEIGVSSTTAIPFTITMSTRPKYNFYFLSLAQGEITVDPVSGRTLVTGSVRFFMPFGVIVLLSAMTGAIAIGMVIDVWIGLFGFVVILYALIGPYLDRSILINLIGDTAILGPKRHHHKSKQKKNN